MSLIGRLLRIGIKNELIITHAIGLTPAVGTIFVSDSEYRVTKIQYMSDVAGTDGSPVTATVVKAAATDTPVESTTPMITADAIDLKATPHTVQEPALTAVKPDLVLAAGDKIGYDLDGVLTAVLGTFIIYLKRV